MYFFFNDTATTEIYTLSLHDALPIWDRCADGLPRQPERHDRGLDHVRLGRDRKSTRLNSSHQIISYAVFCLKKKFPSRETHCASQTTKTAAVSPTVHGQSSPRASRSD